MIAVAAATAAVFGSTALGAGPKHTFTLTAHNTGLEFVTASGSTSVYPGQLQIGDRILARETLIQDSRPVGYDNELCTVTFDSNELCQDTVVLTGQGQIDAHWLWTDWPNAFTGAVDGGTGTFAAAKGEFTATPLPDGSLKLTVTLS